jgi:hypothetical protein
MVGDMSSSADWDAITGGWDINSTVAGKAFFDGVTSGFIRQVISIPNRIDVGGSGYFMFTVSNAGAGGAVIRFSDYANANTLVAQETYTDGTYTRYFTGVLAPISGLRIFGDSSGDDFELDDVKLVKTGLVSELIASNAQSDTGQILDTSGNKNHALLPASGATVVGRPVSQTREVRWTNTWDGTNELQYIGGVNQAILPANAYIESIVGTVSGATPHDIIVGDGSDTDRYVTITTGLAAGTTSFTLANRTTDGTNLKLTVDVDTNATMSIAWVIRYSTLEA